jgi:hypothetical protein
MPTSPQHTPALARARDVFPFWDRLIVVLVGPSRRRLSVDWSYDEPLDDAPIYQRMAVELIDHGRALHWPGLKHTIQVAQLLADAVACESPWGDPPTMIDG